ncbi:hypothetical protein CR513_62092, partial [Mucuna pruriens]
MVTWPTHVFNGVVFEKPKNLWTNDERKKIQFDLKVNNIITTTLISNYRTTKRCKISCKLLMKILKNLIIILFHCLLSKNEYPQLWHKRIAHNHMEHLNKPISTKLGI